MILGMFMMAGWKNNGSWQHPDASISAILPVCLLVFVVIYNFYLTRVHVLLAPVVRGFPRYAVGQFLVCLLHNQLHCVEAQIATLFCMQAVRRLPSSSE
jgi:hypothetical protein